MTDVRIQSIGRAVPARRYAQAELLEHSPWRITPLLERLFRDSPIATRGFHVPPAFHADRPDLAATNEAWLEGALELGGAAVSRSLAAAQVSPEQVDLIAVTTVTGYATPGLDLLLARSGSMRPNIARAHFNCIGCHAAIPLLRVAVDHVRARPESVAVAAAVEVCSACFALDPDPQNLVALALFGDGAASAVLSAGGTGPIVVDTASVYDFDHIDALGFDLSTTGFRIVLDPSIPARIALSIEGVVDRLLREHSLTREQVSTWCFHPGGSRILDEVQRVLSLPDRAMLASRSVLRDHGNMSSPSVLFVLAEAMASGGGEPGTYGLMAAFGPGLGIEVALLRF